MDLLINWIKRKEHSKIESNKMRKLLILSLFSFLLFFGCDQETDINSPGNIDNQSYQLIKLPPKAGLSVENTFSVTKRIDGKRGGEIKLHKQYVSTNGQTVKIDAKLKIKRHSFSGHVDITLTVDDDYAAVSFFPEMIFSKPAELDLKFEGLDLESLNLVTGEYDFVFIGDPNRWTCPPVKRK